MGARDILAERFADDASIREKIRAYSWKDGILVTSVKNSEIDAKNVFEMYYEYEEPVNRIVPHRILAINRGGKRRDIKGFYSCTGGPSFNDYVERMDSSNWFLSCYCRSETSNRGFVQALNSAFN